MAAFGDSKILDNLTPELLTALKDFPLGLPPNGVKADFEHRQFLGHQVLITGCISLAILFIFLIVRTYAKIFIFKKITTDDYIYWISWPAGVVWIVISIVVMGTGKGIFGYHVWDVKIGEVTHRVMMNSRTLSILNGPLQWLQKLTLFSMLYSIFSHVKWMKPAVYGGAIISGMVYISNSIVSGIYCGPRGGSDTIAYFKGLSSPACGGTGVVLKHGIATAAMTVLLDFYILFLPLPLIWKLHISRRKKIGVYLVFLVGLGACICSIISLWYRIKFMMSPDLTYKLVPVTTVVIVETAVGLLIPCTAPFVKIYRHYFDKPVQTHPSWTPRYQQLNDASKQKRIDSGNGDSTRAIAREDNWEITLTDSFEVTSTVIECREHPRKMDNTALSV